MGDRFRPWYGLLLIPLLLVGVWVGVRSQRALEGPQAVLEALQRGAGPVLPSDVPDAESRSAVKTYDRETVYDYLGNDADRYLGLGFQTGRVASYAFGPQDVQRVEAALLRFGMPSGAREAWEAERPEGARPVDGLEDAVAREGIMMLVRGRDLLRLQTDSSDDRGRAHARRVATAWLEQREREADE